MAASEAFKRAVAGAYDDSATSFAKLADRLVFRHLTAPLVALVPRGAERVLDVAGGTGAVARNFESAVCTDLSFGQLSNNEVIAKVQADAETLPFRDASFEAALCAFGINHFPEPARAVSEMERVAGVVGVLTWSRPEPEFFAPREIVIEELSRVAGRARTETGSEIDRMTDAVGNEAALREIFAEAGLDAEVRAIEVEVPWENTVDFVEYRLAMLGADKLTEEVEAVRTRAVQAIDRLPDVELRWRPHLLLASFVGGGRGVGHG